MPNRRMQHADSKHWPVQYEHSGSSSSSSESSIKSSVATRAKRPPWRRLARRLWSDTDRCCPCRLGMPHTMSARLVACLAALSSFRARGGGVRTVLSARRPSAPCRFWLSLALVRSGPHSSSRPLRSFFVRSLSVSIFLPSNYTLYIQAQSDAAANDASAPGCERLQKPHSAYPDLPDDISTVFECVARSHHDGGVLWVPHFLSPAELGTPTRSARQELGVSARQFLSTAYRSNELKLPLSLSPRCSRVACDDAVSPVAVRLQRLPGESPELGLRKKPRTTAAAAGFSWLHRVEMERHSGCRSRSRAICPPQTLMFITIATARSSACSPR